VNVHTTGEAYYRHGTVLLNSSRETMWYGGNNLFESVSREAEAAQGQMFFAGSKCHTGSGSEVKPVTAARRGCRE